MRMKKLVVIAMVLPALLGATAMAQERVKLRVAALTLPPLAVVWFHPARS